MRPHIENLVKQYGVDIKIVEVPPGPPVAAPIIAEIYGLSYPGQQCLVKEIREIFRNTPGITDVDDSVDAVAAKLVLALDRSKAAHLGISQILSLIHI